MTRLLSDHFLRLMSPEDRKAIKQRTAQETVALAEAKTEKQLQEQIAALLRRQDVPYIRPAMFKKSTLPVGWPDFTFAYHGFPIAWECKIANNKPTKEQKELHERLERQGWEVATIRTLLQAQGFLFRMEQAALKN